MALFLNGGTDRAAFLFPVRTPQFGAMSFWIQTTQVTVNAAVMATWSNISRNGMGFILNNTANKILFQGYSTVATPRISLVSTTTINDGNPHHIGVNFDRRATNANALFIDGVQEATGNNLSTWDDTSTGFWWCFGDNPDTFWPSPVATVWGAGWWSGTTLDANEMAALAGAGGKLPIAPRRVRFNSLVGDAPFVRDIRENRLGMTIPSLVGTSVVPHPARLFSTSV